VKWLEKDKQLLAMTDSVDYDVEGLNSFHRQSLHLLKSILLHFIVLLFIIILR